MRVLMVAEGLVSDTRGGGTQRVIESLAEYLSGNGHSVVILTRNPGGSFPRRERTPGGASIHRFRALKVNSHLRALSPLVTFCSCWWSSRRLHRQELPFDIVHYHLAFSGAGVELGRRDHPRTRTVFTIHAPRAAEYEHYGLPALFRGPVVWLSKAVERWLVGRVDGLVFLSGYMRDVTMSTLGLDLRHAEVIPAGVDAEHFQVGDKRTARGRLGLPRGNPLIVTVRRLQARMGLETLIDALPTVAYRHPGALLVIVGEGPLREALHTRAATLNANVHFAGFVPDLELPAYYQAADVVAVPTSELEGFGLTILEGFAADRPVVGTPIGAIPALLERFGSHLIAEDSSASALATKLSEVLAEYRARAASPGFRDIAVRHFSWHVANVTYAQFFARLTEAPSTGHRFVVPSQGGLG